MVGYNADVKLNRTDHVAAGAISSTIARAISQPFDVVKIRFQLQIEPLSKYSYNSKYCSMYQAVQTIIREEGCRAMWKGHVPAQMLSIVYGVVQYTTFEYMTEVAWQILPKRFSNEHKAVTHTVCGFMSASLSMVVVQPLDVFRTRLCAQGKPRVYRSMLHATGSIMHKEGIRGFYKGLLPAVLGVAPQMGMQFGMYASLQRMWNIFFHYHKGHYPDFIESLICGSGAGFISKLIIYPLDLLKKRLQIQGFEEARRPFGQVRHYSGLVQCCKSMFSEEGFLGFYKGLCPSLLKAVVVSGTIFCVYDQICYILSLRHNTFTRKF